MTAVKREAVSFTRMRLYVERNDGERTFHIVLEVAAETVHRLTEGQEWLQLFPDPTHLRVILNRCVVLEAAGYRCVEAEEASP